MDFKNYKKQNSVWEKIANQLNEAQKMKDYYSKLATSLSKDLQELSYNQDSIGQNYVFYSMDRKGPIDYKNIPELKNIDLGLYRKEDIQFWKLEYLGSNVINKIERN